MIAGLAGRIRSKQTDSVLVDVHGVIYRVMTSGRSLSDIGAAGDEVDLHTHLVVREDAMALYGFVSTAELDWFQTLIGVSGIGPRLACAILTRFSPDDLLQAVTHEQLSLLSTVPGVGKRTASRILLDLRGKLPENLAAPAASVPEEDPDVLAALQSLGYSAAEVRVALSKVPSDPSVPSEERVVAALRELGSA